jgi:hypothetical protein
MSSTLCLVHSSRTRARYPAGGTTILNKVLGFYLVLRMKSLPCLALDGLHKERGDMLSVQLERAFEPLRVAKLKGLRLVAVLICRADVLEVWPEARTTIGIRAHAACYTVNHHSTVQETCELTLRHP